MGPREFADTDSISISTTEREKQQALSLHKMAGLCKGDKVCSVVCCDVVVFCLCLCVLVCWVGFISLMFI